MVSNTDIAKFFVTKMILDYEIDGEFSNHVLQLVNTMQGVEGVVDVVNKIVSQVSDIGVLVDDELYDACKMEFKKYIS